MANLILRGALCSQLTSTDWLIVSGSDSTPQYVCLVVPGTVNRPDECGPGDPSPDGALNSEKLLQATMPGHAYVRPLKWDGLSFRSDLGCMFSVSSRRRRFLHLRKLSSLSVQNSRRYIFVIEQVFD
jgi:hypothetical protein